MPISNPVSTVLSGFSFHYIRDDYPNPLRPYPDRADYLRDILLYLGNWVGEPVAVKPGKQYSNSLTQNYPNPFNPITTIKYSIKRRAHVSLKIYNVAGQLVKTLVDKGQIPRSEGYAVQWDGQSGSGNPVSSGVYFCRLVTKNFTKTKKIVLLK